MQPEYWPESADFYQFMAGNGVMDAGIYEIPAANYDFPATQSFCISSSSYYPACPWEMSGGITDTPPEDRALAAAASKNIHKEAEKRRRQRINSHLDKLRTLLPSCNSKTDKASVLGKVIQRVKELKQQTSELLIQQQLDNETFPSETDEISVHYSNMNNNGLSSSSSSESDDDKLLIRASLCCEDRSDLIPDLIKTLKSLRLNPIRAEMATLGGRTRNVVTVAGNKDIHSEDELVEYLRDALNSIVHPTASDLSGRSKRRRVFDSSSPTISNCLTY